MKRVIVLVIGFILLTSLAFGGVETVKDDNDGVKGTILINTGNKNGNSDVGHWTDITTIPELKGAKGDNGLNGKDGTNGLDGINGIDGIGIKGDTGDKGDKGDRGLDFDSTEVIRLDGRIDTETTDRILGDNLLQNNLNTETKQRKKADRRLNRKINKVDKESIIRDDIERTERIVNDNILQNNINTETSQRIVGDTNLNNKINDTNGRINSVSKRVSDLEATQYVVRGELKFIRERHLEVGVYGEYNVGRSTCSEIGLNIVIPIGKSYIDRELDKNNSRLVKLEALLGTPEVQEGIEQAKMNKIKVNTDGKSFWIGKQY
jgi:hypothetical protein